MEKLNTQIIKKLITQNIHDKRNRDTTQPQVLVENKQMKDKRHKRAEQRKTIADSVDNPTRHRNTYAR